MASWILRRCFNANIFRKGTFCSKSGTYINARIVDIYKSEPVGSHLSVKVIGILVYYTANGISVLIHSIETLTPFLPCSIVFCFLDRKYMMNDGCIDLHRSYI